MSKVDVVCLVCSKLLKKKSEVNAHNSGDHRTGIKTVDNDFGIKCDYCAGPIYSDQNTSSSDGCFEHLECYHKHSQNNGSTKR